MGMDQDSIVEYLRKIRNQRTNVSTSAKDFLKVLTGKYEWEDKQCHEFFEHLLRHYIKDENDLDLLLAVSGLKDGYREPKLSAAKRREFYLQFLQKNNITDVGYDALEKREKKLLEQIASDLKADIDSGKIDELLSEWIPNMETDDPTVKTQPTFSQQFWQWMKTPVFKRGTTNATSPKQTSFFASESPRLTFSERLAQWSHHKRSDGKSGDVSPKGDSAVIVISAIVICLLFALLIFWIAMDHNYKMALLKVNDKDIPSASGTDTDKDTDAENVDDLTSNAQKRIVNIDDPEEYDVETMRRDIANKIMTNPVYGDMVAQGLRDIKLSTGETIGDYNPWLVELVEKTDEAMSLPLDQHPRGMERWLEYHNGEGNKLFVTDEYFYDAVRLSVLLVDRLTLVGVREWESCENWIIDSSGKSSDCRAKKNSSQITCPALILQATNGSAIEFIIGFSLDDGRLLIYDPEQVMK